MTDAVESILKAYEPHAELLILLQGGKAFEGKLSGIYSAGYVVLAETSTGSGLNPRVQERQVRIPLSAIVAVTRPW